MNIRTYASRCLPVFVVLILLAQLAHATLPSIEARYDRLLQLMQEYEVNQQSRSAKASLLASHYKDRFLDPLNEDEIGRLDSRDLYFVQLAAEAVLSLAPDQEIKGHAQAVFHELGSRDDLSRANFVAYYRSLVFSRDFEAAELLRGQVGDAALPFRVISPGRAAPGTRSVLARSAGGELLIIREAEPLNNGVYLIGHPYCAWTRRAMSDLASDETTRRYIVNSGYLISPFGTIFQSDYERIQGMPEFEIVVQESQWPEITHWSLPTFVFVAEGEVVMSFTGWPGSERLSLFRQGMDATRR